MLKTALAVAAALFVLAAAPSSQAAPTAGLLAAKSTQNLVEPVYLRRHWHGYRYGKSDIYFVCRLSALSEEVTMQAEEIEEAEPLREAA